MSEPDLSTLPQRMRYAADVVAEAQKRYADRPGDTAPWSAKHLRQFAVKWEAEDREVAEREDLVKELLKDLCEAMMPGCGSFLSDYIADNTDGSYVDDTLDRVARGLIESGWHKGDPA